MFNALFSGLAALLNFFYTVYPSYGFAIAMLTLSVMIFAFPLTAKSMRSMAAMSKLQPELKQIQAKYKNDRQKQSEETMALFKEHGASPVSGCLPMLVQAPVFIVMFRVLRGLTYIPKHGEGGFEPKYLRHTSALYKALYHHTTMKSLGMDLAKSAREALQASYVTAIPFLLLIALSVGLGYYQQYMISKRNPQGAMDDNPMAKQMQTMTKLMPLMYLVWGFAFPAGLNVYFLVSSALRIGQQALIYKLDPTLLPGPGAPLATPKASKNPPPEKPPAALPKSNGVAKNGKTNGHAKPPVRSNASKKKKKR